MNYAIVAAGGNGTRMGSSKTPKQFHKINERPLISYSLEALTLSSLIQSIYIACNPDYLDKMHSLASSTGKPVFLTPGSKTRVLSILNALEEIRKNNVITKHDYVLITDAARPLISQASIEANIHWASIYGASMTVGPVPGTIMLVRDGFAVQAMSRSLTQVGQAPQAYQLETLYQLIDRSKNDNLIFNDFEEFYFHYGQRIYCYECADDSLFKVTNPGDYAIFRMKLKKKRNAK